MIQERFAQQINRLQDQFGRNAFGTERAKLLWREVGGFDDKWFEKVIDSVIANSRSAPILADFSSFISEERERRWRVEKEQHQQDARQFWKMTSTDEERQLMLHTIRERVKGNIPDQDWKCFLDLINTRFGGTPT